jgi:cytochrome c
MTEETIAVSPAVSEDAPSEPHMGEPASESQPQPVYPEGAAGAAESDGAMMEEDVMVEEADGEAVMMEETIVVSPSVADDAPSEPHMGEPASESQPQPVYPDGQ